MDLPPAPTSDAALRALLLTDVVDSTKLSEHIGDAAMARVWSAHDRVARDLLPLWRGLEIDKTDGMLLLFEDAADAVQYALAYHAGLAGIAATLGFDLPWPLRARAGLHVGPVLLRENAPDDVARGAKPLEVDGLAKPTAARVMSLARGGQTLLTPEACAAFKAARAARAAGPGTALHALLLQSHGHWMIKGVSTPVELFEVGADAAAFAAPPDSDKVYRVVRVGERWLPVQELPNNLPAQVNTFVGRERELAQIRALLGSQRLVTLLGMGGLGKTRLSLQVAAEMRAEFPDGVWFIDLSPLRDERLVPVETAQVLDVHEEPPRPLLQVLAAYLAPRRALLVLDNCEHLIKAAADLVAAILKAAPGVRVIASSRELLRVAGEQVYAIHPLPLPARGANLAEVQRSAAARLFIERARSQRPDWELTEREAPAVAELVARLEGIPLALELAAARVRVLPVSEINERLNDRFKLLTGGSRVLQERQKTLRALVDWSYELLLPDEQLLFQRLGIFVGGFDLQAVEAICGDDRLDALDVLDLLASLVDKSLVQMEPVGDGARYRMLETLREYARGKLSEGPAAEAAGPLAARHAAHFFAMAKDVRRGLLGPQQAQWVARMEAEHDNVRAATALALAGGVDPLIAVKLCVAMLQFWLLRGYVSEGRAVVQAALALPAVQATPVAQAHALYAGAGLAGSQGDHGQARQMLETCLGLRRGLGNPVEIAATLSTLAVARLQGDDLRGAVDSETEALALFEAQGDPQGQAIGHLHLGQFALHGADDATARQHSAQALALARQAGLREIESEALLLLGELDAEAGDLAQGRHHVAAALQLCRDSGNRQGEAGATWGQARLDLLAGDAEAAWPRLAAALHVFRDFEMRVALLGCVDDLVAALAMRQARPEATALAAAAQRARDGLHVGRAVRAAQRWQALLAALQSAGAADAYQADWALGEAATLDDAIDAALAAAARLGSGTVAVSGARAAPPAT